MIPFIRANMADAGESLATGEFSLQLASFPLAADVSEANGPTLESNGFTHPVCVLEVAGLVDPLRGNLCDGEDVGHKGGRLRKGRLPPVLRPPPTRLPAFLPGTKSGVIAPLRVSLPGRFGGVFLPSTSAATNGGFFQLFELARRAL